MLLCAALLSDGVCASGQRIVTLEEIYESAEANSAQLRPSFSAQTEASREISVARAGRLPDINASVSVSYIGDGFTGAVMGATLGPALVGEWLRHTMAKNAALLGADMVDFNPDIAHVPFGQLYGAVQLQALVVSMKEIYGWLLIVAVLSLTIIIISYSNVRPFAIFPKWSTVRRMIKHLVRTSEAEY